jgi:hypothetical protein
VSVERPSDIGGFFSTLTELVPPEEAWVCRGEPEFFVKNRRSVDRGLVKSPSRRMCSWKPSPT